VDEDGKSEMKRPLDPKMAAVVVLGSLALTAAVAWLGPRLYPFGQETLDLLPFTVTSQGVWLVLSAWLVFPAALAWLFVRLARDVEPMRLAMAFAGATYFLQCWAELTARGAASLWPELLFTAVPTILLHSRLARRSGHSGQSADAATESGKTGGEGGTG
jgi:hypothetical protein